MKTQKHPQNIATDSKGMTVERYYTVPGIHPFEKIEWERRTAGIRDMKGAVIFEQTDVEVPSFWSQTATNIVVHKYFHGTPGTPQRETSVKQIIERVARTISDWGKQDHYFATDADGENFYAELTHLLVNQYVSFNSPVWFNVGIDNSRSQSSACFINDVEDTMESILELAKTEGFIFKYGSGSGVNLSSLRSSKEYIRGSGKASGPVSFMRGYDAFAGVIKSGSKARRAAKMVILNINHPDIVEFINCKMTEEKKAHALIEQGYNPEEAYDSIFFQNANNSVRVSDAFMKAVEEDKPWQTIAVTTGEVIDTYKARDLLRKIARSTHACGDPGLQYDTTINEWHTCPNSGRINASNPCAEFLFLDGTSCNLASLNLMRFRTLDGEFDVDSFVHAVNIMIIAQEIIVDRGSYPTPKITENSHKFRPLGLGYTNLGALLMARGLPYDNDVGRAYAAAITALMCGQAYKTSARLAQVQGSFAGYTDNREAMLHVIQKHAQAVQTIDRRTVPEKMISTAQTVWQEAFELGEQFGYRNAQATVLAPTGCLVGGTLLTTSLGVVRLDHLGDPNGDQWQDASFDVFTDAGIQRVTRFFVNGLASTRLIQTCSGYAIQGTWQHQIKIVDPETGEWRWRKFQDLQPGDIVPLAMQTIIGDPREVCLPPLGDLHWNADYATRVPRVMIPELAELIGYFMGDGSLHAKGLRLCVDQRDQDVISRLVELIDSLFHLQAHLTEKQGYTEIAVHSIPLTIWWEACGFAKLAPSGDHSGKGYQPYIPDAILFTNDPLIYRAFLRGVIEADGTVIAGVPSLSTAHIEFAQEIKTLLLALGYPTSSKRDANRQMAKGDRDIHSLRIKNMSYNARFRKEIGFISKRKQESLADESLLKIAKSDRVYVPRTLIETLVPVGHPCRNAVRLSFKRHHSYARQLVERIYQETHNEDLLHALHYFYDVIQDNVDGGQQKTYDLSVPANVTYTANGFVSHNTISFMMDCDTTGIEPELALIKYKHLAGGGSIKIINNTVQQALQHLRYSDEQQQRILEHLRTHETIEGAPGLRSSDAEVFDCAFAPKNGKRVIHYMGHLKMMAAVQPFISGGISKTVNVPHTISPAEIMDIYLKAWKMGIKAVAIYRDGSKQMQPLTTSEKKEKQEEFHPVRRRLPNERQAMTHKFSVGGHEGYVTVGLYEDGSPGELFIVMSKEGSTISGLMDGLATSVSLALQYGVPLEVLVNKFAHTRFEPSGFTGNRDIPMAKSILDYIFRWLAIKFLKPEDRPSVLPLPQLALNGNSQAEAEHGDDTQETVNERQLKLWVAESERQVFQSQSDAPPCNVCGELMVRNGSCYKCLNCGSTSGCS